MRLRSSRLQTRLLDFKQIKMRHRVIITEILQVLTYVCTFNYLFVSTQAPFEWFSYAFYFLPVLAVSAPNYALYFFARKVNFAYICNKHVALLLILCAYALITTLSFLFYTEVLQNNPSVTEALCRASLYATLSILPFLVIELFHAELRDWPFKTE